LIAAGFRKRHHGAERFFKDVCLNIFSKSQSDDLFAYANNYAAGAAIKARMKEPAEESSKKIPIFCQSNNQWKVFMAAPLKEVQGNNSVSKF
jgi:hypothetical protein